VKGKEGENVALGFYPPPFFGYASALQHLLSSFFDQDIAVSTQKGISRKISGC
jgi:hypothetical protein